MGRLEQEARDRRVALQRQRMTVHASEGWQVRMIEKVKAPVMEAAAVLLVPGSHHAARLGALLKLRKAMEEFALFPEPTLENTWHPNSHLLIRARDEFLQRCHLDENRRRFLRLLINFLVWIYDTDPPYRMMIDWWAKILITDWRLDIPVTINGRHWEWWDGPEGRSPPAPV